MDPKLLEILNTGYLFTFVLLVILVFVRITFRYIEYKKAGLPIPALLPRDLFLFGGLAGPFVGILAFRALGINPREQDWYLVWILASNTFAISGVGYWVWYEYFKIEKEKNNKE